jgi:uncharacterized protein
MTQPAKSQEPSMEEILASIRRIIADDDASKSTQRAEPAKPAQSLAPESQAVRPEPGRPGPESKSAALGSTLGVGAGATEHSGDVLDLTESMAAAPAAAAIPNSKSAAAAQFRTIDGASDVGFDESSERPVSQVDSDRGAPRAERRQLLSTETTAAVDSAFNALAQTVLVQNARTLEDLVREMLRPLLKSWLDDNLPSVVERMVRAEIERVSRGRAA